ncbi:T9SS type A sorting domain-containing protein [Lutibacter sp.]|uniref:T9SS type A sorting domain-containing protein n=1 Tax=Lutibacter sp. TaxID=1925666 RepID=UPI0025C48507|nr:T9SS type A sorting domain-containing protein [Lutibacter sp.]
MSVYPNPFSNTFIIKSSNHSLLGSKVKVMSRQGVIVYQNIINKKINFINLPKLPSGIYFVTIEHKDGLEKRILIKD